MLTSRARIPVIGAAFLALLAVMPASAAVPTDRGDALDTAQDTSQASVEILNHNWRDVDVYAVTEAGQRYRLGFVSANSTRKLGLPDELVDGETPFRIKVYSFEQTASSVLEHYCEGVKTKVLIAEPGEKITLWLAQTLASSAIIP
jgi:hypothetical protein